MKTKQNNCILLFYLVFFSYSNFSEAISLDWHSSGFFELLFV